MYPISFHGGESTGSIGERIVSKANIQKRVNFNHSVFQNNCEGGNCPKMNAGVSMHKLDYLA